MLCHSSPRQNLLNLSLGAKFEVYCISSLQYDSPVVLSTLFYFVGNWERAPLWGRFNPRPVFGACCLWLSCLTCINACETIQSKSDPRSLLGPRPGVTGPEMLQPGRQSCPSCKHDSLKRGLGIPVKWQPCQAEA